MKRVAIAILLICIVCIQICQCRWKKYLEQEFNDDMTNRVKGHKAILTKNRKEQRRPDEIAKKCVETGKNFEALLNNYKIKVSYCTYLDTIGSEVMKCLEGLNATTLIQENNIFTNGLRCILEP